MDGDFDHLRERLEAIAEELADLGMASLRELLETGEPPVDDKRIGKARRAVEKAAHILSDQNTL